MVALLKLYWYGYVSGIRVRETSVAFFVIFSVFLALSLVSFNANIVQLGMDQLYDYPAKDQSLFIHWFVWIEYFAIFLVELVANTGVFAHSLEIHKSVSTILKLTNVIDCCRINIIVSSSFCGFSLQSLSPEALALDATEKRKPLQAGLLCYQVCLETQSPNKT